MLGGCASTAGLLERPPAASLLSSKSADAAERCLVSASDHLAGGPIVTRGEAETRIAFEPNNVLTLLLTVRPEGAGSRIEIRQAIGPIGGARKIVERCL